MGISGGVKYGRNVGYWEWNPNLRPPEGQDKPENPEVEKSE